jgi:hypothetical protein
MGRQQVDTSRISFGEMVAAASGIALIVTLFLPWYGVEAEVAGFGSESDSASAWEAMGFIDILLFLIAVLAIGMAAARAAGAMPADLPAPPGLIVAAAGALAVVLVLFRIIDIPHEDVPAIIEDSVDFSRKIGAFLGLIAAGGIAFGGYTALNERASGAAPPAAAPPTPPPAPPPSA